MLTRADLLALLRRTTDPTWLDGMLASPEGAASIEVLLKVGEEVSRCVADGVAAGLITTAPGGNSGVMAVVLGRTFTADAVTLPAGFLFRTPDGTQLRVPQDVVVPAGTGTFSVLLETLRKIESVNTWYDNPLGFVQSSVVTDPGSPVIADGGGNITFGPPGTLAFSVIVSSTWISGALADWLSVHGAERGQFRQFGELEAVYRARVRNLPDAVSPKAVGQAVLSQAAQTSVAVARVEEPFADGASALLKSQYGLGEFSGIYDRIGGMTGDFCDDLGIDYELVTLREARAYFRVIANPPVDVAGMLLCLNDGFLDDPTLGYPDAGLSSSAFAAYLALVEEANRKRAAGVQVDCFLEPTPVIMAATEFNAAGPAVTFTLTAPVGKAWLFVYANHGITPASSLLVPGIAYDPTTMSYGVTITFTDATTFSTALNNSPWGERLTRDSLFALGADMAKPIAQIDGVATADGVNTITHLGQFVLTEITP